MSEFNIKDVTHFICIRGNWALANKYVWFKHAFVELVEPWGVRLVTMHPIEDLLPKGHFDDWNAHKAYYSVPKLSDQDVDGMKGCLSEISSLIGLEYGVNAGYANLSGKVKIAIDNASDRGNLSGYSVGDEVIVINNGKYEISEFGEHFIGKKVEVMSLFRNPVQLDIAAVALPDGECCCFRIETLKPVRSHNHEAVIAIDAIINDADDTIYPLELAEIIVNALDGGDVPNYGYSPE